MSTRSNSLTTRRTRTSLFHLMLFLYGAVTVIFLAVRALQTWPLLNLLFIPLVGGFVARVLWQRRQEDLETERRMAVDGAYLLPKLFREVEETSTRAADYGRELKARGDLLRKHEAVTTPAVEAALRVNSHELPQVMRAHLSSVEGKRKDAEALRQAEATTLQKLAVLETALSNDEVKALTSSSYLEAQAFQGGNQERLLAV